MRRVPGPALLVVIAALVLLAFTPASASAVSFNVTGKWTCNNRGTVKPVAGARVELWHDISYWFDDKLGATHTASDGSFNFGVQAGSNFDLYAKLVLNDDNGSSLGDWYSFSDWDTDTNTVGSHSGTVGLGTWQISKDNGSGTPKCGIWQGAHNAYGNYRQVIGSRPPDTHFSISADFPCCGTPFTTLDTVHWPSGYATGTGGSDPDGGYSTSFHEFAHSVRHSFDGNFAHFLFDAARFGYPRTHSLCSNTNQGFAFNEGWAEYWAHTLGTCTSNTQDFNYEGNVATALDGLEKCSSRPTMVRVLRENPAGITGGIHSYSDFKAKWDAIVGPRGCLIRPPIAGNEGVETTLSSSQVIAGTRQQITALNRLIARLSRQLTGVRRRARSVGSCRVARQCVPGIETLSDPSAIGAQIQQAKLVRARVQDALDAARRINFVPVFDQATFFTQLAANRASFERANQGILINGLSASVRTIRSKPGFDPAETTGTFKILTNRLSQLKRTFNRRTVAPASVRLLFSAPVIPVDAVRRVR